MYTAVLMIHSLLRWLVLASVAARVAIAGQGLATGRETAQPLDRRGSLVALILADTQMLLGLLLWGVLSPMVSQARSDIGAAMKDGVLRWPLVEHPTMMILALVAVHVGQVMTKRGAKHATVLGVYGVALLVLLVGSFRHG